MTDPTVKITERRFALVELSLINKEIKTKYGENPPLEILTAFAELAKIYRKKYGTSMDNSNNER